MTDIIRTLDGPIAMLPCVSLNFMSVVLIVLTKIHALHELMSQVRDSTLSIFNNTSLADLI